MKVFLGLHKTVDDKWTSDSMFLEEPAGVVCKLDDGSAVVVVSDGRVMRFDRDGAEGGELRESEDLAAWLRPKIEADLKRYRDLAAAYLVNVERNGDYDYCEARERAARAEAELGILDQHEHVRSRTGAYGAPFDFGCETCHEMADLEGNSDVGADGWCETLCLLGWGYRFRPGYKEAEWKPYLVRLAEEGRL